MAWPKSIVIDGKKRCTGCGDSKPLNSFWVQKERSSGRQGRCIECKKNWYQENKAAHLQMCRDWATRNPGKMNDYARKWRAKNPEKTKAAWSKWAKNNPDAACFKSAKRRSISAKATPKWANRFFIQEAYDLARRRTKLFGFKWVVDHIVPLQSPIVCGLHVEHNMRVITEKQNSAKCNYWWPEMP